jgi:hypothetical protein
MSDWFDSELGIAQAEHCPRCGEGDSDWCDDCNGCQYSSCDTCTCEREFAIEVHYYVTVEARSLEDITDSDVQYAVENQGYPDSWEQY